MACGPQGAAYSRQAATQWMRDLGGADSPTATAREGEKQTDRYAMQSEVGYLFSGLWRGKGEGKKSKEAERERERERSGEGEKWGEAEAASLRKDEKGRDSGCYLIFGIT